MKRVFKSFQPVYHSFFLKNFKTFSQINLKGPLIEPIELKILIDENHPQLRVLDCSLIKSTITTNEKAFFLKERVLYSQFYDIDEIADKTLNISRMLPTDDFFCKKMKEMDIRIDDIIVCYDKEGIYSSPRVWFNLKLFGAKNVYVLNGGYEKCINYNVPLQKAEDIIVKFSFILKKYNRNLEATDASYKYIKDVSRVRNINQMYEISEGICRRKEKKYIIDVRKKINIGEEKDLNPITRNGNIAGAELISYEDFINPDFTFKSKDQIIEIFKENDIDINNEITFYSNSGVIACVGILALDILDKKGYLYDGSWEEYGTKGDNDYFRNYREERGKLSPNELTDQYIENLPKEERGKVEIQKILMTKSKEMEKIKREMHDKKEQKKYNDDYDIPDNLY